MPEPQWLTMDEAQIRFKRSYDGILSMIEDGSLQAMKIGRTAGCGSWRILDPTPEFLEKRKAAEEEHIFHIPLLTIHEAAEVLGTTPLNVRQMVFRGQLKYDTPGKFGKEARQCYFTVAEIRRFLWKKEKRQRQGRRVVKINRVIQWAKVLMDQERAKTTEGYRAKDEIYELLEEIMALPAEQRLASLRHTWRQFDLVQAMVTAANVPLPTGESRSGGMEESLPEELETILEPLPRHTDDKTNRSVHTP